MQKIYYYSRYDIFNRPANVSDNGPENNMQCSHNCSTKKYIQENAAPAILEEIKYFDSEKYR